MSTYSLVRSSPLGLGEFVQPLGDVAVKTGHLGHLPAAAHGANDESGKLWVETVTRRGHLALEVFDLLLGEGTRVFDLLTSAAFDPVHDVSRAGQRW